MPDDARRLDLGTAKLDPHDLDQTDELIGIPRADLRSRQRLGLDGDELFGGVHTSIFPGGRRLSTFLPREDILVEYPDLRDQDIELVKRIVTAPGSRNESFEKMAEVDGTRFRRRPVDSHHLKISEFDRWVSENNIPERSEYSKG